MNRKDEGRIERSRDAIYFGFGESYVLHRKSGLHKGKYVIEMNVNLEDSNCGNGRVFGAQDGPELECPPHASMLKGNENILRISRR